MKFWDSSAIIPLCIEEKETSRVRGIIGSDGAIAVWWGCLIECFSAFARLRREGFLSVPEEDMARNIVSALSKIWTEIMPSEDIKIIISRLMLNHPLKAADSMQLAAAIIWADKNPLDCDFVCYDIILREAARKEGFTVLPEMN